MRVSLALVLILVGLSVGTLGIAETTDTCREGYEVQVVPADVTNRSGTPVVNYSSLSPLSQEVFRASLAQMNEDEYVLHPTDRPADFRSRMVVIYGGSKYFVELGRFQYCDPNYGTELLLSGLLFATVGGCFYRSAE